MLLASWCTAQTSGRGAELARVVAEVEELAFEVPGRAVRRAEEGLVEFEGVGAAELARLQLARGEALMRAGRCEAALLVFEGLEGAELGAALEGRVMLRRAGALLMVARAEEGREWLARASAVVEEHGGALERAGLHATRGVLAQIEGEFDAALGHYRAALAEAQAGGERRYEALYLYNIATVQAAVGDNDGALRTLEHASELDLGRSHAFALLLTMRAGITLARGGRDEARALYAQALAIERELGSAGGEALLERKLGDLARQEGEAAAAWEHYQRSLELTRGEGNREALASSLLALADVALDAQDLARARNLAEEARALADELVMPVVQQHAYRTLARVLEQEGELARALDLVRAEAEVTERFASQSRSAALERLQGEHRLELERVERAAAVASEQRVRNLALFASGGVSLVALALVLSLRQKSRLAAALARQHEAALATSARLGALNQELEQALADVRLLSGLLPICAHCKAIRDTSGTWQPLESYVSDHSDARFSHGICPSCFHRHHPELEPPAGRG